MSSYRIGTFSRHLFRNTLIRQIKKCEIKPVRNFSVVKNTKGPSILKLAITGATVGIIAGTGYSLYNSWRDKDDHVIHERKHPKVLDKMPDVKINKKIVNPKDSTNLDLVLFQFQTCPFCCKVRAYLDYAGLSYSVVEVDAVLRQDLNWSDYKKVPMLLARRKDGKYVQLTDSSTIISILASFMLDTNQDIGELAHLYPNISFFNDGGIKVYDVMNKYFLMYGDNTPKTISNDYLQNERRWRDWADSTLVHLISPNVYRTRQEAFETFEWFSQAGEWDIFFPKWERDMMVYVGANAMWLISKRLKKRHALSDDVRSHIYDALNDWTNELEKKNMKFMGGKKPNLADVSVYGVLNSMEGCQAFKDCLQNTKIADWFNSVKAIINTNRGNIIREYRYEGKKSQPNMV